MNLSPALQHNVMIHHLNDSYRDDERIDERFDHAPMVDSAETEHLLRELAEMQEALDEIAQCVIY